MSTAVFMYDDVWRARREHNQPEGPPGARVQPTPGSGHLISTMISPPVPPHIRPATGADADAVTTLLVAQLREHRLDTPKEALRQTVVRILDRPRHGRLLVATDAARVVGVAACSFAWPFEHAGRSLWLEELYVVPEWRGRGVGTTLLAAVHRLADEVGAVAIDLEVDVEHERAAHLYARAGFSPLPRAHWVRRIAPAPHAPEPAAGEVTGGCFCGAVRYRAAGRPLDVAHCHCGICRRTTGAPFVTWATFLASAFRVTAGTPTVLRATPRARRTFCAACGTAVAFEEAARPHHIDVTVGSMDHPDGMVPRNHIWTGSALPWLHLDDDLPRHPGENPAGDDNTP